MNIALQLKTQDRIIAFALTDEEECKKLADNGAIYEPEVTIAMLKCIRPGDYVIDGGANLGYFTLLMSQLVGPTGEVLAFEPDPVFRSKLQDNLMLNDAANVQLLATVLWDADEMLTFHLQKVGGLSSVLQYSHHQMGSFNTTARSLDSLLEPDDHTFRLMKFDCEGSEERILHGAERLLQRGVDFVILELNSTLMPHMGSTERSIRDYMGSLGYQMFLLNPYGAKPLAMPHNEDLIVDNGNDDPLLFNVMFSTADKVEAAWT